MFQFFRTWNFMKQLIWLRLTVYLFIFSKRMVFNFSFSCVMNQHEKNERYVNSVRERLFFCGLFMKLTTMLYFKQFGFSGVSICVLNSFGIFVDDVAYFVHVRTHYYLMVNSPVWTCSFISLVCVRERNTDGTLSLLLRQYETHFLWKL